MRALAWKYIRNLCIFEMCDISNPVNLIMPIGTFHTIHIRVAAYSLTQSRHLFYMMPGPHGYKADIAVADNDLSSS